MLTVTVCTDTTPVIHAEANAIMHKTCISLKGCRIYTTLFPCNECAKLIIQSGITEVYYLRKHDKPDKLSMQASRHLLSIAGYDLEKESSPGDASNPTDQQPSKGTNSSKWVETCVVACSCNLSCLPLPMYRECRQYRPKREIHIRWPVTGRRSKRLLQTSHQEQPKRPRRT